MDDDQSDNTNNRSRSTIDEKNNIIETDTKTIKNRIHVIDPQSNVLSKFQELRNSQIEMGEVIHKTRRDGQDFYLIVKDETTYDIDFQVLFNACLTLKEILLKMNVKEISIFRNKNTFENLKYNTVKGIIHTIFKDTDINIVIYIKEVTELEKEEEIKKVLEEYHSSRLGGHMGCGGIFWY